MFETHDKEDLPKKSFYKMYQRATFLLTWANHRKVVPLKMCPVRNGKHALCENYCRYNVIFALKIYQDIRDT